MSKYVDAERLKESIKYIAALSMRYDDIKQAGYVEGINDCLEAIDDAITENVIPAEVVYQALFKHDGKVRLELPDGTAVNLEKI